MDAMDAMIGGRLLALALALGPALPGCAPKAAPGGGDEGPTWIRLAGLFRPGPMRDRIAAWEEGLEPAARSRVIEDVADLRAGPGVHGVWLETALAASAWRAGGVDGEWVSARPSAGAFAHTGRQSARLVSGGRELRVGAARSDGALEPGTFTVGGDSIRLSLPAGEVPGDGLRYGLRLQQGLVSNGLWRMRVGHATAEAVAVWAGTSEEVRCDVPPGSTLRFATSRPATEGPTTGAVRFHVTLDGEPLFDTLQTTLAEEGVWHEVPLPAGGRSGALLRFGVEGSPGLGFFLDPVVGPSDVGAPGARPWGAGRPNLALFLADTFRADNLAAYGGTAGVTPNLDALADESLCFLDARSPATWTLPAVTSLLTGRFPPQHQAVDYDRAVARELVTVTEQLAAHGYRTVAITDGALVSREHNLDQGFAWFQEAARQEARSLQLTFDRAREWWGRDDGRPVFLLVHTYRTHSPFRRGVEEDETTWDELTRAAVARAPEHAGAGQLQDATLELAGEFEALYRAGARDLDELFGVWLADLRSSRFFTPGLLVVTSDHGEAFGEHGEMWHRGRGWDVKLRVPLLLHAPELAARRVPFAASLVDLPATLAAAAGVPPDPGWLGQPLVELDRDRPQFAFRLSAAGPREVVLVDRARKVMAPWDLEALGRGEFARAFDLDADPAELDELEDAAWAAELCRRLTPALRAIDAEGAEASTRELSEERQRALAELGYLGEER